jgi:hypothetical protein
MEATAIKARLEDAHPEHLALRGHYDFMRQAYEGGWDYIRDNIFRHGPRETHTDYVRRLERAVYPNYCRPVIRTYRNHVFRFGDRIGRNIGDDAYQRWARSDVDRRGSDANHFWSCVATLELLYGWAGVLVDMPKPSDGIRSAADQQSTDQMPYFILVSPTDIIDWGMDEFGALEWIRIEESSHGAADPFATRGDRKRYRVWTRSEWMLLDGDGDVLEGGEHSLGVVPFVPIRFEESVQYELAGVSFMSDFARINRMIANSVSLRDGFLAKNMLQILTMQVNFMAEAGNDTDLSQSLQDGSMLEYPPDAKAPSFIAPDVAGVEWALAHAEELRWELYRIATQKDIRSEGQMRGQSGLSKMLDFEEQNAALALFADGLERAETQATKLWFAWRGVEWDDTWKVDRRQVLFRQLSDYVAAAERSKAVRDVIVDGSFVTDKDAPGDIDLLIVPADHYPRGEMMLPRDYNVLSARRIRGQFEFDVLLAGRGSAAYDDYTEFYAQVKLNPMARKGTIRIRLC